MHFPRDFDPSFQFVYFRLGKYPIILNKLEINHGSVQRIIWGIYHHLDPFYTNQWAIAYNFNITAFIFRFEYYSHLNCINRCILPRQKIKQIRVKHKRFETLSVVEYFNKKNHI